jgi:hypothetical protein
METSARQAYRTKPPASGAAGDNKCGQNLTRAVSMDRRLKSGIERCRSFVARDDGATKQSKEEKSWRYGYNADQLGRKSSE